MDDIHDVFDLIEAANNLAEQQISQMEKIRPAIASIDDRAARYLWIDSTCIACKADSDRTVQYYAGFEYVAEDCRKVIGEYVFYLIEGDEGVCSRIEEHIERAKDNLRDQGISIR